MDWEEYDSAIFSPANLFKASRWLCRKFSLSCRSRCWFPSRLFRLRPLVFFFVRVLFKFRNVRAPPGNAEDFIQVKVTIAVGDIERLHVGASFPQIGKH